MSVVIHSPDTGQYRTDYQIGFADGTLTEREAIAKMLEEMAERDRWPWLSVSRYQHPRMPATRLSAPTIKDAELAALRAEVERLRWYACALREVAGRMWERKGKAERETAEMEKAGKSAYMAISRRYDQLDETCDRFEAENERLRVALEQSPCKCQRAARCQECGNNLVEGRDQYSGSWICGVCVKERDLLELPVVRKCTRCAALDAARQEAQAAPEVKP